MPSATAAMTSAVERPAGRVEGRRPADLDVADAVGGLRLDELGGDPGERVAVLEQADRQVERAQELGLRRAVGRGDEHRPHRGLVPWRVHVPRPGQLERGRR